MPPFPLLPPKPNLGRIGSGGGHRPRAMGRRGSDIEND